MNKFLLNPVLHVYSQYSFHDEAVIIGNLKGLKILHETIGKVIENNSHLEFGEGMTNDGEGYDIIVIKEEDEDILNRLAVPYSAEYAAENRENAIDPYDLIKEEDYKKKQNKKV